MRKSFYDVIHSARVGCRPKLNYNPPVLSLERAVKVRYKERNLWADLYKLIHEHDPSAHLVRLSSDTLAGIPDVWYSVSTSSGLTVHGFWELKIGRFKRGRNMRVDFSQGQFNWHQSKSKKVSSALVFYDGRLYRIDDWHYIYRHQDLPNIPSVKWPKPDWRYFEKIILNPE